jgi:hypothetical protein
VLFGKEIYMPRTRERVAQELATKLNTVEQQVDEVIASTSDFLAIMPTARIEAQVASSVGHDAITAALDALANLVSARNRLISVHHSLANVRDELGLRETASGALWKLPKPNLNNVVAMPRKAA